MQKQPKYKVYIHIFPNGKMYCGQTMRSMEVRKRGYKPHTRIGSAIAHFGIDNLETIVLQDGLTKEDADYFERRIIHDFELQNPMFGYNITSGGDGGSTYQMTDERKKQISTVMQNFWDTHPQAKMSASKKMSEYLKNPDAYARRIDSLSKTRPLIRKCVQCVDLQGNIIGTWESARAAERFFDTPSIHFRGISSVCHGRQRTHGGYVWRFVSDER